MASDFRIRKDIDYYIELGIKKAPSKLSQWHVLIMISGTQ